MVDATAVPVRAPVRLKKAAMRDRLARCAHLGRHNGGDRIGGVVKAVDVLEGDRRQDNQEGREAYEPASGRLQEYLKTIWRTMLPASRQRSITFSSSS